MRVRVISLLIVKIVYKKSIHINIEYLLTEDIIIIRYAYYNIILLNE